MAGLDATADVGARKPDLWTRANSERVGRAIVRIIKARTARGVSALGQPFEPYAPETAAEKGSTKVTLRATGRMLDGLTIKATATGAVIQSKAPYAGAVDAVRPWLALTEAELKELDKMVSEELDREEARIGQRAVRGGSAL